MKKRGIRLETILVVLLLATGLLIRSYNLSGLTTFEWDQARDVAVMSQISDGRPTLIGPVVRGMGSFFLGPLYYYMGAAALLFTTGNPLALSVLSVMLDTVVALLLYIVLRRKLSLEVSLFGAAIWIFSKYLVDLAHTPWNVSLLGVWMLTAVLLLQKVQEAPNSKAIYWLFFVLGLSTHVHLTAVPVAAVFYVLSWRSWKKRVTQEKLISHGLLFLPLTPLILFDLRHDFLNTKLFVRFFESTTVTANTLSEFVPVMLRKVDYTVSDLLLGMRVAYFGIAVYISALIMLYHKRRAVFDRTMLILLLLTPAWLLIYRDIDFAEYYLVPLFVPIIYGICLGLDAYPRKKAYLLGPLLTVAIYSSVSHYNFETQAFSLENKASLARYVSKIGSVVDLRAEAPPGRRDGIEYLLDSIGVDVTEGAPTIAVVTESGHTAIPIDRALVVGKETFGGLQVTIFKVRE